MQVFAAIAVADAELGLQTHAAVGTEVFDEVVPLHQASCGGASNSFVVSIYHGEPLGGWTPSPHVASEAPRSLGRDSLRARRMHENERTKGVVFAEQIHARAWSPKIFWSCRQHCRLNLLTFGENRGVRIEVRGALDSQRHGVGFGWRRTGLFVVVVASRCKALALLARIFVPDGRPYAAFGLDSWARLGKLDKGKNEELAARHYTDGVLGSA